MRFSSTVVTTVRLSNLNASQSFCRSCGQFFREKKSYQSTHIALCKLYFHVESDGNDGIPRSHATPFEPTSRCRRRPSSCLSKWPPNFFFSRLAKAVIFRILQRTYTEIDWGLNKAPFISKKSKKVLLRFDAISTLVLSAIGPLNTSAK